MLTKTRSDFWKCEYSDGDWTCNWLNSSADEQCAGCGRSGKHNRTTATNVEVLAAWLLASDDRRKEIEIASRPTKAGRYKVWYMADEGLEYNFTAVNAHPNETFEGYRWEPGLWEQLSE